MVVCWPTAIELGWRHCTQSLAAKGTRRQGSASIRKDDAAGSRYRSYTSGVLGRGVPIIMQDVMFLPYVIRLCGYSRERLSVGFF